MAKYVSRQFRRGENPTSAYTIIISMNRTSILHYDIHASS